jgi:hypothetical protein
MQVRRKASPILRGIIILGTQPLDIGWRVKASEIPTFEEISIEGGRGKSRRRMEETVKRVVEYLGPTLRPVDFFRWYMWPTTVNDLADADLCFEDFLQDPLELSKLSTTPIVEGREKGKGGLGYHIDPTQWARAKDLLPSGDNASDKWQEQQTRLAARGFNSPHKPLVTSQQHLDCSKGYWRTQLPGDEEPAWYEFILGGDTIPLRMRGISTGFMQAPSYVVPKFVEVWEEFYGYGLPMAFDSAHYLLNDIFNQGADALTWSLNPIAAIDPDAIQDHTTLTMKPGAKWLVRMPRQNIAWMEPPKESGQVALQSVSQLVGLINDVAGVQPFAPGGKTTGKGRSVETLGGLQILASEGQLQAGDVIQGWEDAWFNPMLRRMYDLNMCCLDEPLLLNVEGLGGAALIQTKVTRANLIGEFEFKWLSSTYQYNAEVRSQQMLGFLQTISRIPPQILEADNTKFRIGEFLRMIYSDGLMLPNASRVFQDAQPVKAVSPDIENELFQQGQAEIIQVSPADNDDEHDKIHQQLSDDISQPEQIRVAVLHHRQQHQMAKLAKRMMQAQQQAQRQLQGGMGGPALQDPMMNPGAGMGQAMGGGNGQDRLALPHAPGRMPVTTGIDDLARMMPRPGGQGPGGMQ